MQYVYLFCYVYLIFDIFGRGFHVIARVTIIGSGNVGIYVVCDLDIVIWNCHREMCRGFHVRV